MIHHEVWYREADSIWCQFHEYETRIRRGDFSKVSEFYNLLRRKGEHALQNYLHRIRCEMVDDFYGLQKEKIPGGMIPEEFLDRIKASAKGGGLISWWARAVDWDLIYRWAIEKPSFFLTVLHNRNEWESSIFPKLRDVVENLFNDSP